MKALFLMMVVAGAATASDIDAACDEAAYLLFNRHLDESYLDSAYGLLGSLREENPENERVLYLWSRIHVQKGDDALNRGKKLSYYEQARAIAETLIALNGRSPEGHLWWAVAHGRIGQTRGVLNSLFMIPDLKREIGLAVELDPGSATAYDVWGVFFYEVPSFVGGDLNRSEEYLRQAIQVDPNYTVAYLDLARTLAKMKRWKDARAQLSAMLGRDDPTFPADFYLDDKPAAEKLLREIEDR